MCIPLMNAGLYLDVFKCFCFSLALILPHETVQMREHNPVDHQNPPLRHLPEIQTTLGLDYQYLYKVCPHVGVLPFQLYSFFIL